jgi:hypothetical protein
MTLRFVCPSCQHVQEHGGTCDQCGLDFAKYALVLQLQAHDASQRVRNREKERSALLKQAVLLPITGGLSLVKFVSKRLKEG